jgi:hypothetical protein
MFISNSTLFFSVDEKNVNSKYQFRSIVMPDQLPTNQHLLLSSRNCERLSILKVGF